MYTRVFVLFICCLSTASALLCYECPEIHLDFWVDKNTVPAFPADCSVVEAKRQCSTTIRWEGSEPERESFVNYMDDFIIHFLSNDSSHFFVLVDLERELATQSSRSLLFSCTTDRCNDRASLQRVFDALTVEDNFASLDVLLSNGTASFTEQDSCVDFANSTHLDCPPSASSRPACAGCFLAATDSTGEVCARCPEELPSHDLEHIARRVMFFPENRTRLGERSILACRTKGCNALDNVHKIHQLSKLEFDFDKFIVAASDRLIVSVVPFLLLAVHLI